MAVALFSVLADGIVLALGLVMTTLTMVSVRKLPTLTVDAMQAAKIAALIASALQGGK